MPRNIRRRRGRHVKKSKVNASIHPSTTDLSTTTEHSLTSLEESPSDLYESTAISNFPDRRIKPSRPQYDPYYFGRLEPELQQYFKGVEKTLEELVFETAEGMDSHFNPR